MAAKTKSPWLAIEHNPNPESLAEWIQIWMSALSEGIEAGQTAEDKWTPPRWQGVHVELWQRMQAEGSDRIQFQSRGPVNRMTIGRGYELLCSLYRLVRTGMVPADRDTVEMLRQMAQSLYDAVRFQHFLPRTKPWANRRGRHKVKGLEPGRVFRVKVRLLIVEPVVWREFLISDCSLDCLHAHIQAAIGWENQKDYLFRDGNQVYEDQPWFSYQYSQFDLRDIAKGIAKPSNPPTKLDSKRFALSWFVRDGRRGRILQYQYESDDAWDEWKHKVILRPHPGGVALRDLPLCTKGAMACPLEGFTHGPEDFMKLKRQLRKEGDLEGQDWEECLSKVRPLYDFDRFDREEATENMRRVHRGKP
jgi:hypothetical protein